MMPNLPTEYPENFICTCKCGGTITGKIIGEMKTVSCSECSFYEDSVSYVETYNIYGSIDSWITDDDEDDSDLEFC